MLICAKSYGWSRRRSLAEIPLGFRRTKQSVACRNTARLISGTNWLAWWTALSPASEDLACRMRRRPPLSRHEFIAWRAMGHRRCNSLISAEFGPPPRPSLRESSENDSGEVVAHQLGHPLRLPDSCRIGFELPHIGLDIQHWRAINRVQGLHP